MFQKTLRKSFWSLSVLTVLCSTARSKVRVIEEPKITVSIHNDARIPLDVLLQAESEASRIFSHSGLEIRWLNCLDVPAVPERPAECATAGYPRYLHLRITNRSLELNELTMGVSYLAADGAGCYADIFFDRALLIHETTHISLAIILGHGIAHEIGHLLLGINSHTPAGLMRARWQPADLASATQGRLLFSPLESREMRNKLTAWQLQARADSR